MNRYSYAGPRPRDRALAEREPPIGAHVVAPRRGYTHHGIYVGGGRVVQYGGLSRGLRRGPVEEVLLSVFSQGRPISVRISDARWFERDEVVRRARLRIGENRYNLFTNNCEHFCEWCVRGEHRSYQIEDLVAMCVSAVRSVAALIGRLFPEKTSTRGSRNPISGHVQT